MGKRKPRMSWKAAKSLVLPLVSVLCDGRKPFAERQAAVESLAPFSDMLKSLLPVENRRACLPALQRCMEDRPEEVDPYHALCVLHCLEYPAEDLRLALRRAISTVRSCCDLGGRVAIVAKKVLAAVEGSLPEDRYAYWGEKALTMSLWPQLLSIADSALVLCRVVTKTHPANGPSPLSPDADPVSQLASGSLCRSDRRQSTDVAGLFADKLESPAQGRSPDSSVPTLIPAIRRPKSVSDEDAKKAVRHG